MKVCITFCGNLNDELKFPACLYDLVVVSGAHNPGNFVAPMQWNSLSDYIRGSDEHFPNLKRTLRHTFSNRYTSTRFFDLS